MAERQYTTQQTPQEKLDKLKADLNTADDAIKKETKKRDDLKTVVAAQEKIVSDLGQIVGDYKSGLPNINKTKSEMESYHDAKFLMIDKATTEDQKKDVTAQKDIVDADIKVLKEDLEKNKTKAVTDATTELNLRKSDLESAQKSFSDLGNLRKRIETNLQDLSKLKTQIEDVDPGQIETMYFLITQLKTVLDETKGLIQEEKKFEQALNDAWDKLGPAKETVTQKEAALKTVTDAQTDAEKKLVEAEQNRRKAILDKIGKK